MTRNSDFSAMKLSNLSSDEAGAALWTRDFLQQHLATTYAVKDPKGIEELKPVNIGGIDQWLHIRGRNRDNPVLLYLHGGPGSVMIGFMDATQRPWEDYFTVVHWDQRQTGKSYYPADDDKAPLTVNQFIEDTEEVIQYLREYLNKDKLFLLGHSWGSVLGMNMVKHHPDWFYAYIGVGQVVDLINSERTLYKRLFGYAQEHNEGALASKIENSLPFLNANSPERGRIFAENCEYFRKELSRFNGEVLMHNMSFDETLAMWEFEKVMSPHLTLEDINNSVMGDTPALFRSPYAFTTEFCDINLPADVGYSFNVPIFFFTGNHDWQTPKVLSDKWFEEITAPYKELVCFEESSHVVVNEEPGKFLMALVNKVLPFAKLDATRDKV